MCTTKKLRTEWKKQFKTHKYQLKLIDLLKMYEKHVLRAKQNEFRQTQIINT